MKPIIHRYWLGSSNITQMIIDTFEIAGQHGLEDFCDQVMQSRDRSLLWLSGARTEKLTVRPMQDYDFDLEESGGKLIK